LGVIVRRIHRQTTHDQSNRGTPVTSADWIGRVFVTSGEHKGKARRVRPCQRGLHTGSQIRINDCGSDRLHQSGFLILYTLNQKPRSKSKFRNKTLHHTWVSLLVHSLEKKRN
jgi:hypothetical protein